MKRKFATRYLLPLEMYMSAQLLSWGLSGIWGAGPLWGALFSIESNLAWGWTLIPIATVHLAISMTEWFRGRAWRQEWLYRSVSARCMCSFLASCVWVYAIYLTITVPGMTQLWILVVQAPLGLAGAMLAFCGNSKIQCVLDPKCATEKLEGKIMLERKRSLAP